MEKKTLTSLAMITFLMTSTAVIAMGDEEKPATTASALQLKKIEEQIPSTPPKKAWSFFGIFTWGGSDSSTIEASPASMPSSAPAIEHLRENSGPTEEEFLQASMSLTRDQLQELIKDEIIPNPTPALTVPSSDPVESLSTEQVGALRRLWNRFWGTGSATETKVLPGAVIEEDRASVPSSSNLAGSSSQIEPEVRPSVKLNPASFAIVRDDIKGRGLMTPFSFNSPQEGSFKVSGEGTLFYQVLSKPLMDSFVGQKLLLEAEIKSETAGGYLQYFNGIDRIMSYPYSGENGWQKLQLEFTVKDDSRCHIVYPLVMPPQTPGSDIPVVEIRNINLNFAS